MSQKQTVLGKIHEYMQFDHFGSCEGMVDHEYDSTFDLMSWQNKRIMLPFPTLFCYIKIPNCYDVNTGKRLPNQREQ